MKPIPGLDALLDRAVKLGVFGTKMRSVINLASPEGIAAIVAQAIRDRRTDRGAWPRADSRAGSSSEEPREGRGGGHPPGRIGARAGCFAERSQGDAQGDDPGGPDLYSSLLKHDRVARVVALSGGYSLKEACERLAANHGMIASFSRALVGDLRHSMSDADFDAALADAIAQIYQASTVKRDGA